MVLFKIKSVYTRGFTSTMTDQVEKVKTYCRVNKISYLYVVFQSGHSEFFFIEGDNGFPKDNGHTYVPVGIKGQAGYALSEASPLSIVGDIVGSTLGEASYIETYHGGSGEERLFERQIHPLPAEEQNTFNKGKEQ